MTDYTISPEHIFLRATEVIDRYRWGRTKGYKMLAAAGFPSAIEGRYRLDVLIAWENDTPLVTGTPAWAASPGAELLQHTFLTSKEVVARYRWGRTKGYQVLRSDDFPCAIAGAYRLDTLIAWEELQLRGSKPASADQGPPENTGATTGNKPGSNASEARHHITELPRRRRTRGTKTQEKN